MNSEAWVEKLRQEWLSARVKLEVAMEQEKKTYTEFRDAENDLRYDKAKAEGKT